MLKNTTRNKNTTIKSDDIRADRKAITKVIIPNTNNPKVIEINISMFAIPNNERTKDEYDEQIDRVVKTSQRILRKYVLDNQELFDKKFILDINFTSANLRKGYNKSVQMSLFVKLRNDNRFTRLKSKIKETIRESVSIITSKIKEEDFKCFKRKQSINKNI